MYEVQIDRLEELISRVESDQPLTYFKGRRMCNHSGLCFNILMNIPYEFFNYWPHYSGYANYPIPHESMGCRDAYLSSVSKYDQNTQYGRLRLNLAKHLLSELKQEALTYEQN